MVEFPDIDLVMMFKIVGVILAIVGIFCLFIGAISLTGTATNGGAFILGAVLLAIGIIILKVCSDAE